MCSLLTHAISVTLFFVFFIQSSLRLLNSYSKEVLKSPVHSDFIFCRFKTVWHQGLPETDWRHTGVWSQDLCNARAYASHFSSGETICFTHTVFSSLFYSCIYLPTYLFNLICKQSLKLMHSETSFFLSVKQQDLIIVLARYRVGL